MGLRLRSGRDRAVLLALVGVFAVAVVLRLADVGARLSAAEGYSWLVAAAPGPGAFLDRLAAYENTPPLFYLLLHLGPHGTEAALRWPAVLGGVLAVAVLFLVVVRPFGVRAALLAALALAVAPYHVSYSDYSRGFMLAGLGTLVALLGGIRLAGGGGRRWWWAFGLGGTLALWSEYDAALALAAILGILLVLDVPRRREVLTFGAVPFLSLAPWIGQVLRGLDAVDETKRSPVFPGPSPASARDLVASLAFGEHGAAGSPALRSAQALLVLAALAALAALARRGAADASARRALVMLLGLAGGLLVLHAVVAVLGPNLFNQRYLTLLIPLACAVAGIGLAAVPWRPAVPVATAVLLLLGAGVFVRRLGREYEPPLAPAARTVLAGHPREVLTNSAVAVFALHDRVPVRIDRPFGLGAGAVAGCPRPCGVIEDLREPGGARPVPGRHDVLGVWAVSVLR